MSSTRHGQPFMVSLPRCICVRIEFPYWGPVWLCAKNLTWSHQHRNVDCGFLAAKCGHIRQLCTIVPNLLSEGGVVHTNEVIPSLCKVRKRSPPKGMKYCPSAVGDTDMLPHITHGRDQAYCFKSSCFLKKIYCHSFPPLLLSVSLCPSPYFPPLISHYSPSTGLP